MPVAIMYQPPGGDSYQSYQTGTSMTTAVTTGSSSTHTQITEWDYSQSVAYNLNVNYPKILGITGAFGLTATQNWSGSTQNIVSSKQSNTELETLSYQVTAAFSTAVNNATSGKGDPNMLVPGYEPFWDDASSWLCIRSFRSGTSAASGSGSSRPRTSATHIRPL